MYQRVIDANEIDEVIIATSGQKSDEGIVEFCKLNKIVYFCGSLDDVLDRYYHAAKIINASIVVRLTGDCPLIDHKIIDNVIDFHIKGNYDYTSNAQPPTFPDGMDVGLVKI